LWELPTVYGKRGRGGRGVQELLTELDKPWCKILALLPSWVGDNELERQRTNRRWYDFHIHFVIKNYLSMH
jgi:hypothetical protein